MVFEAHKVGVFINDVPVPFIGTRQWSLMRGVRPFTMEIVAPDDRFSALENPVELRIVSPGGDGSPREVVFKRLYLLYRKTSFKGLRRYLLADFRWLLGTVTLTAQYNIRSYGGKFRALSIVDGRPFGIGPAIQNALERLIQQLGIVNPPDVFVDLSQDVSQKTLPENLGNSTGGGWVGAKLDEFFDPMVGEYADLTMTREGDLFVTSRSEQKAVISVATQPGAVLYDGDVVEKDIHWQKPLKIIILFEKRLGGLFRIIQESGTQVAPNPDVMEIENVIPRYTDDIAEEDKWLSFPEFFADVAKNFRGIFGVKLGPPPANNLLRGGVTINDARIRKNMMKPLIFDSEFLTAPDRATIARIENVIRTYWRTAWRVTNTDGRDDLRKRLADIKLGVLQKDGTTNKATVFGDYVVVKRWQATPDETLSENMLNKTAPFIAEWLDRDQMVFFLQVSETISKQIGAVYLGQFEEPIGLLTLQLVVERGQRYTTEDGAVFADNIDLGVSYHGLYVGEEVLGQEAVAPVSELFSERLHRIFFDAFPDGEIESVEVMARGVTANFRRFLDKGPYKLLNEDELFTRADFVAGEIRKSYEQDRAGILRFGGVGFLADNLDLEALGEIYSVTVTIGMNAGKEYEIVTVVDVRPEVRIPVLAPIEPAEPVSIL